MREIEVVTTPPMSIGTLSGSWWLSVVSTLSREVDVVFHTQAGPEICVASTKAYVSQLVAVTLLGLALASHRGALPADEERALVAELARLPEAVQSVLAQEEEIVALAGRYAACHDFFFLGRGLDHCVAQEGALKLKEISYRHAEALAAGEMKHGTLALVTPEVCCLALATQSALREKMISNVKEVKARGATVIALGRAGDRELPQVADHFVPLPPTRDELMPILAIVPLQLLAYHVARLLDREIDQPRNLAKSVTVE